MNEKYKTQYTKYLNEYLAALLGKVSSNTPALCARAAFPASSVIRLRQFNLVYLTLRYEMSKADMSDMSTLDFSRLPMKPAFQVEMKTKTFMIKPRGKYVTN